jgi:hypothetical protein
VYDKGFIMGLLGVWHSDEVGIGPESVGGSHFTDSVKRDIYIMVR